MVKWLLVALAWGCSSSAVTMAAEDGGSGGETAQGSSIVTSSTGGNVAATGGATATGGAATGGTVATGGSAATGGAATGGMTTGGSATGGASTGGARATGGAYLTDNCPGAPLISAEVCAVDANGVKVCRAPVCTDGHGRGYCSTSGECLRCPYDDPTGQQQSLNCDGNSSNGCETWVADLKDPAIGKPPTRCDRVASSS